MGVPSRLPGGAGRRRLSWAVSGWNTGHVRRAQEFGLEQRQLEGREGVGAEAVRRQ